MKGHRHNIIFVIAIAIFSWTNALTSTQYQKTGPSPRQSISCRALSTTEDRNINGCTENRHDKRKNWNGLISPYRILHSDFFACTPDPSERKLPLHSSLRLLKRALGMIANNETNVLDDENSTVIRIEHKVSHTVDPLCWLHAQTRLVNKDTALYFATAEGTLETAVYGSAKTHKGTVQEEDYWELVSRLPPRTNIYGGQRFDKDSEIGEEWSEFSKGLWILPAIEIRQERDSHDASTTTTTTTVAVHLFNTDKNNTDGFSHSAKRILSTIQHITDLTTTENAPTTLPPVLSRASNYGPNLDGQEIYERSVSAALAEFNKAESSLEKVVLARRMDLNFGKHAVENVGALDILRKWKFASKPGGHLFYINPGGDGGEFFGCTPERLFQVQNGRVLSEALAGTRPRGSTQAADEELSRQLFGSAKDQNENVITGKCIKSAFTKMRKRGWLNTNQREVDEYAGSFYVRRLRHLQHLCQRFDCVLSDPTLSMEAIRFLLSSLHPTPAVGGLPQDLAMNFIRNHETIGFDRGFYSGPVGFVNKDSAEIFVAIRSGLVCRSTERSKVLVYAGAGIVPGSTVQGEWAETSYKLAVVSSIFPQSPITLQSAPTPNAAWATAFIEELVRNGVTQFYICPGSRSTPLVAAIAKSVRSNVGTVHALSVHDERGAGFRALGWGRGKGHPAAVITSSGTAIANLYPAIIEAGIDGVPLIIVTADRPYESRDSGANQAIDQVKAFSSSYIRWFRDILPPSDEVPVAVTLNDAAHGVNISKERRGPVHFNVQFRENLAPDGGAIRNDNRAGSVTSYDSVRFTETPGFKRWSNGGGQWMKSVGGGESILDASVIEIASLIKQSKRGIIVVGNLRKSTSRSQTDISEAMDLLSAFAQSIGFPIIAGVQGCSMRFESPAVIPFAEHLLRLPVVQDNLKPDLVLQFGTPLVSTEVFKVIKKAMSEDLVQHILIHPHHPTERADPEFTVSHKVDSEILPFTKALAGYLEAEVARNSSQLAPLVNLGRSLQSKILSIVTQAAAQEVPDTRNSKVMTEPEIILCLSNLISERKSRDLSLFLSNSMPVRDAEAFLYPLAQINATHKATLVDTTANRGASGIDGIIASAAGFADATSRRTTLLIGDVAALHDINSLHSLRTETTVRESQSYKPHPMTIIIVNNDGGGIFSFLPIAKHGSDVAFEEFFGTPTNTFSFQKGAQAFGLPFEQVTDPESFLNSYTKSLDNQESSTIIEVIVAPREVNVATHRAITQGVNKFLTAQIGDEFTRKTSLETLPFTNVANKDPGSKKNSNREKTLVLLHGWMGDSSEWDDIVTQLLDSLTTEWSIIAIDLPGHGDSYLHHSSSSQMTRKALGLHDEEERESFHSLSIDQMAKSIYHTLKGNGIEVIDALAGYSLGGRVALAMKRMSMIGMNGETDPISSIVTQSTKLILISAFPGEISVNSTESRSGLQKSNKQRMRHDDRLSNEILDASNRLHLTHYSKEELTLHWSAFLKTWYSAPLWGELMSVSQLYQPMVEKRISALSKRGKDLAAVLRQCSPARCRFDDWRGAQVDRTLFITGSLDKKYSDIGEEWLALSPDLHFQKIKGKGHALLVEAPREVADTIQSFLESDIKKKKVTGLQTDKIQSLLKTGVGSFDSKARSLVVETIEYSFDSTFSENIGSLDFEAFSIGLLDEHRKQSGVVGIGWGDISDGSNTSAVKERSGFIIQLLSVDGSRVGVGEVSPLLGLHPESLEAAEKQLNEVARKIAEDEGSFLPAFDARKILAMNGGMEEFFKLFTHALGIQEMLLSVRSGLEMALISLASQVVSLPIHQALWEYSPKEFRTQSPSSLLSLNGLITRGSPLEVQIDKNDRSFDSWKVKIGHQNSSDDVIAISSALQLASSGSQGDTAKIRADANRGFDETKILQLADTLKSLKLTGLEYIEEPLEKIFPTTKDESWRLDYQVEALEGLFKQSSIPYALDESISDLADANNYKFDPILEDLKAALLNATGCAALVLKPSLLGLELSMRLARAIRRDFSTGALVTSSFDTGIGLSYASFLGSLLESSIANESVKSYSHGLGTFTMLEDDCLYPPFASYVNQKGQVNVASLSRAFYGLGLGEIRSLSIASLPLLQSSAFDTPVIDVISGRPTANMMSERFEASTTISSDGREITVVASLPLPFSADIACARFTDLPQQPRWSPWINSVAYLDDGETEWTLQVRGISFRWRATSSFLDDPNKGIQWKSVSGLNNKGFVEFIPEGDSCEMKVGIVFITPRILSSLFRGTSVFFEDFLRNKILKWSLEMFRDVVKGDLALEEGNIELGDALFGSVEGKASAIEATLSTPMDE